MNGLSGIDGLHGLGRMNSAISRMVNENATTINNVLKQGDYLKGLGKLQPDDKMNFAEVMKLYNKNISNDEIRAWVWYKRQKGIPMKHYPEKYKINSDNELKKLVKAGALFVSGKTYLPLPIFTFGNMYDRLSKIKENQDKITKEYGDEIYQNHLDILKKAMPARLSIKNPDPGERPIIQAISKFAHDETYFTMTSVRAEYLSVESAEQLVKVNGRVKVKGNAKSQKYRPISISFDGETKYTLRDVFIKWIYSLDRSEFGKSNAIDITEYYVYGRSLRDDELSADQKAQIKTNARNEGETLFAKFLHEVLTDEDQTRLDFTWNAKYNAQSDINYLRVPVSFECSRYFKSGILQLTPIQREGIAFMEAVGSGINAFDVGVGKTMTAIATAATALYNGQAKRVLIVVPKPTYKKWLNEIRGYEDKFTKEFVPGVLSNTDISVIGWSNLGVKYKNTNFDKKVEQMSITLVTYEGFKKIGFSQNISDKLFTELSNILMQAKEDGSERDKEINYQKLREKLGIGNKNTVCDIDKVGFDYLIIDEAHRAKNVFSNVKSDDEDNKRYNISGNVSETGIKAFFLANYIQRTFGNNVMLLTATPFTNSPLEIYSMLSLVAYNDFVKNGIQNLNDFFNMFILPTTEWAANYKDEIVEKEVIKSFTNRLVLQKLIYNHILYKTGDEAGVKRPCKINLPRMYEKVDGQTKRLNSKQQILTYLKPTVKQKINQDAIVGLAKSATSGQLNSGDLFRALNYSLDNALSPYLYKAAGEYPENYKQFVDESPKIKYTMDCVQTVKKWHEGQRNKDVPDILKEISGQVIYMNRGKRFFPMIKEYLEKEIGFKKHVLYNGIRFDEVEILDSSISEVRKENVKEAFLGGGVKIIIGTATIREGIDLQKRGTVVYNLYPDWNPTDLHQLEGRIWRQGNEFAYVRVVIPLVQDSMDVFVFQKLEEKTSRINDIWYRGDRGNVLDVESMDPQEIKLALITDVGRIVALYFDEEKKEFQRKMANFNASEERTKRIKQQIESYFEYRKKALEYISNILKDVDILKGERKEMEERYGKPELKKAEKLRDDIQDMQTATEITDMDILKIGRRCSNVFGYHYNYYNIQYFKEYVSKVRNTERTLLKPRGLTINDDLSSLIGDLEKEKQELDNEAKLYEGGTESPRFHALYDEILQKKKKLSVEGRSPGERAKEFSKLNYLLGYLMGYVNSNNSCEINPGAHHEAKTLPIKKTNPDFERRLRLAEAEAEAEILLLKLMNLDVTMEGIGGKGDINKMTQRKFINKIEELNLPYSFHLANSGSEYITVNGEKYRISDHYQPSWYQVRNYINCFNYNDVLNHVLENEKKRKEINTTDEMLYDEEHDGFFKNPNFIAK